MSDIDKVINGLECCHSPEWPCSQCPYVALGSFPRCNSELTEAALEMIKYYKKMCGIMFNRCRATSYRSAMCACCKYQKECEEMHTI